VHIGQHFIVLVQFGSNAIVSVNEMNDLGVKVDNHLDFKLHINNIVAQTFVRSNLI